MKWYSKAVYDHEAQLHAARRTVKRDKFLSYRFPIRLLRLLFLQLGTAGRVAG